MSENVDRTTENPVTPRPLPAAVALRFRNDGQLRSSPHAHKFRIAFALLIGLGIGAVIVTLAIAISGVSGPPPAWSSWSPQDKGITAAEDIAAHIAPLYRLNAVEQLAVVTVVNTSNANSVNPLTGAPEGLQVALRGSPPSSTVSVLPGNTVAYDLCGYSSSDCAIDTGAPSTLRELLLRREALELALYTLKYVSNISNVVAILPPGYAIRGCTGICTSPHPKRTHVPVTTAVVFTHSEVAPLLDTPLRNTLQYSYPPAVSELPLWAKTREAEFVSFVTGQGLFSSQVVHAQDGSTLVELSPEPTS